MFGFIRSISLSVQVMIPVIGLILFGVAFVLPGSMAPADPFGNGLYLLPKEGWLYSFWMGIDRWPLWAQILPSYFTALLTALLLVSNDQKNLLIGRRSYAMAFVFLFILASSGHYFLFHPAFLAGMMMVFSQRFLLDLYKHETDYSVVFLVGFTWGVAVLLYPPVLVITPAILFGLLLMVSTSWRHWAVVIMGIAIPALLAGIFWYLIGDLDYQWDTFLSWFQIRNPGMPAFAGKEPFILAWLGIILVWTVIASLKYRNPKIQSRQLFQSNFLWFFCGALAAVFLETVTVEILWLMVIPLTYLMTFWLLELRRGWVRDLFFLSLLASFIFFRIRGLL